MNNPFIDLTATLILLIAVLIGGYLYAKNKEESGNKVVEIPATIVKPVIEQEPKYDTESFEHKVKRTE